MKKLWVIVTGLGIAHTQSCLGIFRHVNAMKRCKALDDFLVRWCFLQVNILLICYAIASTSKLVPDSRIAAQPTRLHMR